MTTLTNPTSGFWLNQDGMIVKFGSNEASADRGGEYPFDGGPQRILELKFDYTDFTSNVTIPGSGQGSALPKGAFIEKVEVFAEVAVTSGGSATIDVGGAKSDYTTLTSQTAFIAALPKASVATAGVTTTLHAGDTYAGAAIGTKLSDITYVTVDYNVAALTTGKIVVRIYYYMPTPASATINSMTHTYEG